MNGGAPTCPACGGLNTNPQALQCAYCGTALPQAGYAQQQPWPGYGPPPPGYGAPPPGYGAQPGFGPPPGGGYGAPNPYAAQNPYAPQNPYAGSIQQQYPGQYPVQGFGGVSPFQPQNVYINRGWSSGWSTFFWIRLGIAAVVIGLSLMGACVNAITH